MSTIHELYIRDIKLRKPLSEGIGIRIAFE